MAGNFALLVSGELAAKLITFLVFAYLGRVLGADRYGGLEFVLATMVFFALPVDFGLGVYGAREIAKDRTRASSVIEEVSSLRLVLAVASFAVLLGYAMLLPVGSEVRWLLLFYGLSLFASPALFQWVFQGCEAMRWVAAASIVRQGTFGLLVLLVVRQDTPVYVIGLIECAAAATVALACALVLHRGLGLRLPRFRLRGRGLPAKWRAAAPIGLSELAWAFLWYFPTVQLGFLATGESLGQFGASHRIVMALHTFVWLYFFNLLPGLSRRAARSPQDVADLIGSSLGPAAWAGVFVALSTSVVAETVLVAAFGPGFAGGGRLLAVLVWLVPVAMLSGHYRYSLIAHDMQGLEFLCTAAAAAVSVTLGFLLIPVLGALGAAVALVAAQLVNLVLAYRFARQRIVEVRFLPRLVMPLATAAVSLGAFVALAERGPWLAPSAAMVVFFAALLASQGRGLLGLLRPAMPATGSEDRSRCC